LDGHKHGPRRNRWPVAWEGRLIGPPKSFNATPSASASTAPIFMIGLYFMAAVVIQSTRLGVSTWLQRADETPGGWQTSSEHVAGGRDKKNAIKDIVSAPYM
jgi:hypothetical protein